MTWSLILVLALLVFLLVVILGTFAYGGISAAPWVPIWQRDVDRMLALAAIKPGEIVYDLGAGDGRIVITAAQKYHAQATGFEIAVLPYIIGYIRIQLAGVQKKARLRYRNFYDQDLSAADVIFTFLTPPAMEKLKSKFVKEIKPGARVVSYAFDIKGWEKTKIDKPNEKKAAVYLYQR